MLAAGMVGTPSLPVPGTVGRTDSPGETPGWGHSPGVTALQSAPSE